MDDSLLAARRSSLEKSNQPKRENPETANMNSLFAARSGAVPTEGNEDLLRRAAKSFEPGTDERDIFKKARLNAQFNIHKLGKLGPRILVGKSRRRRNKKGKKKTNKRRRN